MGGKKAGKGKKGGQVQVVAGAAAAEPTNQQQPKNARVSQDNNKNKSKKNDDSMLGQSKQKEVSGKEALSVLGMIKNTQEAPASEKAFRRISKELEMQTELKLDIICFNILDNNLIDSVYSNLMTIQKDKPGHSSNDLLAEQELVFHLRKITKELQHISELPFAKFWAYMVNIPAIMAFLDGFLQNVRKYNDLEKMQIDLDQSFGLDTSKLSSSGEDIQQSLKRQVNRQLRSVFTIFFRLCQNMEGESEYFTMDFWRNLVYDNQLFDVAKMLDIAAIYGVCNKAVVKDMLATVFEQEPRYAGDFKEAFDMMLTMFKRVFKDAHRTDQMIRGDAILQKSASEQDDIILLLLQDALEILSNFLLITQHFGDSILDQVSNTNFMVLLTNAYCMARKIKKFWLAGRQTEAAKQKGEFYVGNVLKLTIQTLVDVLNRGLLQKIGHHTKNFAVVQNKLATTLKAYIMTIIGNVEMSKDVMHKSINFICHGEEDQLLDGSLYAGRNYSANLFRQLFKRGVHVEEGIRNLEERFLPESDKDFLLIIVDSMQKGQHVQVKKVRALHDQLQQQMQQKANERQSSAAGAAGGNAAFGSASLTAQDRQNITQIAEMFGDVRSKQFIEKLYLTYERNYGYVVDLFISGQLPAEEPELQVIVKQDGKQRDQQGVSTTYNQIQAKKKKEDLRKYILEEYSDILGASQAGGPGRALDHQKLKGNKYYQNHLKALELRRQEEEQDVADSKVRTLQQAALMQYDDDFDEEALLSTGAQTRQAIRKAEEKQRLEDRRTAARVQSGSARKVREKAAGGMGAGIEEISEITDKKQDDDADQFHWDDDDDDDVVDEMARFVEGQDLDLVKDRSAHMDDDEKDDRRKASRKKQLLDDLREDVAGGFGGSRDPFQGMTAKQRREAQTKRQEEEMSKEDRDRQKRRGQERDTRKDERGAFYGSNTEKDSRRGGHANRPNQERYDRAEAQGPDRRGQNERGRGRGQNHDRGGGGRGRPGNEGRPRDGQDRDYDDYDSKVSNRGPPGRGARGGDAGRGRGDRRGRGADKDFGGRGGYRDDFQRDAEAFPDEDAHYTRLEPSLHSKDDRRDDGDDSGDGGGASGGRGARGRGARGGGPGAGGRGGRGRGRGQSRGGHHNQRDRALKKSGLK